MEQRLENQIQQTKEYSVQQIHARFWINFACTFIVYLLALIALYLHIRPWLYQKGLLPPSACLQKGNADKGERSMLPCKAYYSIITFRDLRIRKGLLGPECQVLY